MLDINKLRNTEAKVITIGSHPAIIQSILDFDFFSGKERPSVKAVIATGRKFERYFWGQKEVLIPVYSSFLEVPEKTKDRINLFLNLSSGRRVLSSTESALDSLPNVLVGAVFAEGVPEIHSLELSSALTSPQPSPKRRGSTQEVSLVGPASIGLLIPKVLKLGAIGGVDAKQLVDAHLFEPGEVAVLSASGGMTNEIINTVVHFGKRISFSLSFGGERFPMTTPKDAFLAAEADPETKTIVYFGELGGTDEYDIARLLKSGKVTKEVICYIAGTVAEMFETPPQFGHAKALASKKEETAKGKREMLKEAGAKVADSYAEFLEFIKSISSHVIASDSEAISDGIAASPSASRNDEFNKDYATIVDSMQSRRPALITTGIFSQTDGQPELLGEELLSFAKNNSFAAIVGSLFLGHKIKSKEMEDFTDFVLRISVDHGPSVSGAVNTIVTARAGRDLVSSLSAGLLTIGPRFGGAINQAAINWLTGVQQGKSPAEFVEDFASKRQYVSGIGHKKYRVDSPDPRVDEILRLADGLSEKRFTNFALGVEKVTTAKKGNLILNVDGTIACVLLDILSEKEGLNDQELHRLTEIEFFNALFVLSRSVGFIAHFLDQKRLDEGLFRLDEDLVVNANTTS